MSLTLGIFDVFTYAIPGSLYLGLLAYVADRLGWLDLGGIGDLGATGFLLGAALASYLLGHVTYVVGRTAHRLLPVRERVTEAARREFAERIPNPEARRLVRANPNLLLAVAEIRAKDVSLEISRLRAAGLMLQNSAPALILGSLAALAELVAGQQRPFAASCSALLLLAAFAAMSHGRRLVRWSIIKTFEVAFWVTESRDLDRALPAPPPPEVAPEPEPVAPEPGRAAHPPGSA